MTKTKLQPLKGFRDFLPEKMAIRNEVIKRLRGVFEKYGFEEIQTPTLEYKEVLTGKYGEEAEKLMYLFKDNGGRNVGMRYDLTVPLARFMASNRDLPLPFKKLQIQPVWRADKPQKGRYREITMCDIDIVGSVSPLADAEIIAIINDSLTALGFMAFKIRVNSRQVLNTALEKAKISSDLKLTTIQSIDKLDKKTEAEVKKELKEKGLNKNKIDALFAVIKEAKPDEFLEKTMRYAAQFGVLRNLVFDPTLARGLDYYTGPIFESIVDEPKIGSITGGGRYDKLLKSLGGPDLPATGTTFGLDRIVDVIEETGLWKEIPKSSAKVLVTIFSPNQIDASIEVANLLRNSGINTEVYPDETTKLVKQFKYADKKGFAWAVVIGPKETLKKSAVLKNLKTKKQETIPVQALLTRIK